MATNQSILEAMEMEQLIQIRRRLVYLKYSTNEDISNYESLKKEQENLRSLFKNNPNVLRMEGIRPALFGDLIMKSDDSTYRGRFLSCSRNEVINAIDKIIAEDI